MHTSTIRKIVKLFAIRNRWRDSNPGLCSWRHLTRTSQLLDVRSCYSFWRTFERESRSANIFAKDLSFLKKPYLLEVCQFLILYFSLEEKNPCSLKETFIVTKIQVGSITSLKVMVLFSILSFFIQIRGGGSKDWVMNNRCWVRIPLVCPFFDLKRSLKFSFVGRWHSTKVAFALPIQLSQVWYSAFPKIFRCCWDLSTAALLRERVDNAKSLIVVRTHLVLVCGKLS